jgi:hypothetical protein
MAGSEFLYIHDFNGRRNNNLLLHKVGLILEGMGDG